MSRRVCVFAHEVPDGRWGARGQVRRLPDILAYLTGEHERQAVEDRLADRHRKTAVAILDAAVEVAGGSQSNPGARQMAREGWIAGG